MEGRPIVREANLAEFSKDRVLRMKYTATEPRRAVVVSQPLDAAKKTACINGAWH